MDESGTHEGSGYLVIGMLFVGDHGPLHSDLCKVKEDLKYFNGSARKARYKEIHLTKFRHDRDVEVAKGWIDAFVRRPTSFFRAIVIDWSMWDGRFFGDPFDPDALKKRRAYKKWAEMLLEPEINTFRGATLFLDRLRILYGYDILDHLRMRFEPAREGVRPRIEKYQPSDSWTDAMQCLQLADLLTGSVAQRLTPSSSQYKRDAAAYVYRQLPVYRPSTTWAHYQPNIIQRSPRFCEWHWRPDRQRQRKTRRR